MDSSAGNLLSQGGNASRHESVLPKVAISTTILFSVALLTYGLRMYTRLRPTRKLQWDDHTMTIAVILAAGTYATNLCMFAATGGRHLQYISISSLEKALYWSFVSRLLWAWAVTTIKISVALMILRIKNEARWRRGIFCLVVVLLIFAVAETVETLVECRPVKAYWHIMMRVKPGVCVDSNTSMKLAWVAAALFGLSDVICALLPLTFIRKVQRPLREKVLLSILMGLGMIACFCGIMRAAVYSKFLDATDPAFNGADVVIWTYTEEYLGIIAANLPCLRALMQKTLKGLGGQKSTKAPEYSVQMGMTSNTNGTSSGQRSSGNDSEEEKTWADRQIVEVRDNDMEANLLEQITREYDNVNFLRPNYHKESRS